MPERDLDERLDAVERTLTDGDTDLSELQDAADVVDDVRDLESRIGDLESRIDELEAGLQAVRGYAGNVRAVNREVERRASAALAKAETLETAVEDVEDLPAETSGQAQESTPPQQRAATRHSAQNGSSGSGDPIGSAEHHARDDQRASERKCHDEAAPQSPDSTAVESRGSTTERNVSQAQSSSTPQQQQSPSRSGAPVDNSLGNDRSRGNSARTQRTPDAPDPTDRTPDSQIRSQRGHDESVESAESTDGDDDGSQTEQFIERVRDAL